MPTKKIWPPPNILLPPQNIATFSIKNLPITTIHHCISLFSSIPVPNSKSSYILGRREYNGKIGNPHNSPRWKCSIQYHIRTLDWDVNPGWNDTPEIYSEELQNKATLSTFSDGRILNLDVWCRLGHSSDTMTQLILFKLHKTTVQCLNY